MSGHASRRRFLRLGGAAAASGLLPGNLQRALAIPAERKTGTIRDVEHIVILMQENRSFDHYFGCLNGVRGFGDPRAEQSPEGKSVFAQADGKGGTVYPFRLNTMQTSSACLASLDHSWKGSQAAWNAWDCWIPHKTAMTMGHFTRKDIPYYYALADAFTICDAYHASIFGPTNPNRLYFFSGTSGLSVGEDGRQAIENVDDGNWSANMTHDRASFEPFSWSTYPEALQKAGVSWKVYQEYDNFGDNPLASFATFRNVSRESWAYRRARAIVPGSDADNMHTSEGRFLVEAFEHDIAAGNLPQVSWIVPSAALSEHPDAPPGYGEHLVSSLMDVFVRHPETWAKTVFILNYDENDGFFDHVPPPVPALDTQQGYSSVPVAGESYHGEPVGLGPRVPALVISPWTKGGWVNSQVFDHTSVLRFIEARFGVPVEHLTPWRRAICGDLTSLFDFSMRDTAWPATLPDTSDYLPKTRSGCRLPKPVLPAFPRLPRQERGQRPARALPYAFEADLVMSPGTVLRLRNTGRQGATFRLSAGAASRHYTLDTGTSCDIPLDIRSGGTARLHGPNGFFRAFRGNVPVAVRVTTDGDALIAHLDNVTDQSADLDLRDGYGDTTVHMTIPPRTRDALRIPLAAHAHWYDFTVSGPEFELHYAGHVETGMPSRTDPHLG